MLLDLLKGHLAIPQRLLRYEEKYEGLVKTIRKLNWDSNTFRLYQRDHLQLPSDKSQQSQSASLERRMMFHTTKPKNKSMVHLKLLNYLRSYVVHKASEKYCIHLFHADLPGDSQN